MMSARVPLPDQVRTQQRSGGNTMTAAERPRVLISYEWRLPRTAMT